MSDDIVATTHGYTCRYTPTIMSGPVYRWAPAGHRFLFELSASRDGVMLHGGSPCLSGDGLAALRAVLLLAGRVHERLASDDRGTDVCRRLIEAAG